MRIFILIFFFLFQNSVNASIKSKIISNFNLTENLKFNFVQKIDKKIEKGECIIAYPKRIFCKYDDRYNKILVSNGKSLIINSDRSNQYYRYRLDKTPLNLILDKNFLIKKIKDSENQTNSLNYYSFKILYEKTTIILHFDKNTLNLIGWITYDIYQNKVETKISNVENNLMINNNIFKIQNYIN
ncbi:MAG TPA: outer membrane lipoprotein carrier protein LolA [Candidatus Pelagibacter bacterium]|jgi:outer membrane lipoprotein-sorting protein|nr:outer membrane lipoprotein carrier protein LolA [Candidatus Pelagibacter bacterium]|tara:strand:+ start:231 stop:785 length:555 start_codon:yes stop_codon:yes gene_type:complete